MRLLTVTRAIFQFQMWQDMRKGTISRIFILKTLIAWKV